MAKTVHTTRETKTGRNTNFRDKSTGKDMTRKAFVKEINQGKYSKDYHVRIINGIATPASNPDKSKKNNLGMNSRRDFLGGCFYAHFYFIRIKRPKRAIRMTAIRMMMTAIATSIEIAKIH